MVKLALPCDLEMDPADLPNQGLVVQVPHSNIAIAAAREADFGVRADGQGVAGRG